MPLAEYLEGPNSAQSANDAAPPSPENSAAKMRKKVFLQFGALVALGLALAGWYVGYRVFKVRAGSPPAAAIVVHTPVPVASAATEVKLAQPTPALVESKSAVTVPITKPIAAAPAAAVPAAATPEIVQAVRDPKPVKRKDFVAQPFRRHDASPHAGEKYLQIAAFGPRALDGFLKTLEGQGLHPVVAPGPVDNIYRILVGPFPNSAALEETRSLIKASGIEPILRVY
jgi:sporulation related protein